MNALAHAILEQARALPREERLAVASELLAMSEEDDALQVESEWAREIERRGQRALSGESNARPWSEVEARVLASIEKK